MNIPIKVLKRLFSGPAAITAGFVVALGSLILATLGLRSQLDVDLLGDMWTQAGQNPSSLLVGLTGFTLAFLIRSVVWSRLVPGLNVGQSWAAIHVALGANHVLPFRLGEPLRVVSAARRSSVATPSLIASTIALRTSDILTLILLGLVLAPRAMVDLIIGSSSWLWTLALITVGLAALGAAALWAHRSGVQLRTHLPSPILFVITGSAWLLESVLVWQVAGLADVNLSFLDACLVTSVAVSAQFVAIAPGGIGTYEAAATAALVLTGVDATAALSIAVFTHLLKTLYSLITGAFAMTFPRPSFLGRLRVPRTIAAATFAPPGDGPIVLFMPAYQEGPRIADVIARTPETSCGRPVLNLVINDGSTDDTVAQAEAAGATVRSLPQNTGLGAAVAEGLRRAVSDLDASVVVFCDADGEYDPADIDDLVKPILAGDADYVIGSRFSGEIEHMRPHRRFGNLTLTRWVRWMTRTSVSDGQSGYRALSAQAATAAEMAHDYNYAQVLTIDLIQKGFRYSEVPITYRFRESGDSFVKLGTYLRTVLPTVWRLLNKPVA